MSASGNAAAFTVARTVGRDWVDYNGHMGDYAYAIAFSESVTAYMDEIGLGPAYREATGATLYTLDFRIGYRKECHEGDELKIQGHVLEHDARRLHVYLEMLNGAGELLAWNQQVLLHVSRTAGNPKAAPFPQTVAARLVSDAGLAVSVEPVKDTRYLIGLKRS